MAPSPQRHGPAAAPPAPPGWRPARGWLAAALGVAAGGVAMAAYAWLGPIGASGDPVAAAPAAAVPLPTAGTDGTVVDTAPGLHADPAARAAMASRLPAGVQAGAAAPANGAGTAAALPRHIVRQRDPGGDLSPDLADQVNEGESPTMGEVIDRLHLAGVHSGLGAFQKPGTRPPLVGLAVPDDFALPPGYVRHHQVTDDGQRIEAILMYSPDQPPALDSSGRPLAVPPDRVVPAEQAPPGLALRRVVVPAPLDAGGAGR